MAKTITLPPRRIASDYPGCTLETWYVTRLARTCVSDVLRCDPLMLGSRARGTRKLAFARTLSIHLVHIVAGRPHEDVASAFYRNRSTASHHFEEIENLRDDEAFDLFLTLLEQRFSYLLCYAETRPDRAWPLALTSMARAVKRGALDADAHFYAKFVVDTFTIRPKRVRAR